jgi:hypothetical protein
VDEGRFAFFQRYRQGQPQLQAFHRGAAAADVLRNTFGMHDAAPGNHQVGRARFNALHAAQAVTVHQRTAEQIGEGGQPDMRVRPHIVIALIQIEMGRAHVVQKNEGTDMTGCGWAAGGAPESRYR